MSIMLKRFTILISAVVCMTSLASADPFWIHQIPGDVPLSLAALPDVTKDNVPELVVGHESGTLTCLRGVSSAPDIAWSVRINGSVLHVQPIADIDGDGFPGVFVATDLGVVACVSARGPAAGKVHWRFDSTFNVAGIVVMDDMNGDGRQEVAFGGADHRVRLLNGATGDELWTRLLDAPGDIAYVDSLVNAGDLDGDGRSDLFVRTWGARQWALSGANGADIWPSRPGSPYLSTLVAAHDENGDGRREFLVSGNDGLLRFCDGKDGSDIWTRSLGRPIRAIFVPPYPPAPSPASENTQRNGGFVCFAGNAEGKVACIAGADDASATIRWTADVGDVCRQIVSPGDLDKDGLADIVAGAENGVVAAFSGADGKTLWKWQGTDVARALAVVGDVDGDGAPDVAASLLEGGLVLLPGRPARQSATIPPVRTVRPVRPGKLARTPAPPATEPVEEVPILLYHDVPPRGILPSESSPIENFREQMDFIVKNGYTVVSLDEIAEWAEGKRNLPPKPVCITFDGQYASHHAHVMKILQDRGLFAISYITTDWIGTTNHLDWHELRRLEASGVMQIENHSVNHPSLSTVSEDEAERQLVVSNEAIRRHLDGKISRHHAYPNGVMSPAVRDLVRRQGFRTATSVYHCRALRTDNLFGLARYTISEQMPLATFKMILGHEAPPYPALPYKFAGTVGGRWRQASYGDVDAEGRLWVCDYSANHVRVFLPDGTEAPFSPITQGMKHGGESWPVGAPSGVASTPSGEILVSISNRFGEHKHTGLFRYRAADGTPLPGFDLPYYPGDVDTDANGLIYVVDKLSDLWHLYTPKGAEVPGSPFGENTGLRICRGITVTPDSKTVYVLSESSADVRVWKGSATRESARYARAGTLLEKMSAQCGGIDVMDDGTVLVGMHDEGMILAFDGKGKIIGQISGGGPPTLSAPRGVAFRPDGGVLWTIGRFSQVQRWEKIPQP